MKKRKELDALVPNGKVKKKHSSSSGGATHELLQVDSDTTETEDFSVLQPRKFPSKKAGFFSRLCSVCMPVCTLTMVMACVVGSGTLIWMQFNMRQEVDLLRDHMRQVEEGNKGTPTEFHGIHSQLNDLQKNHTALKDDVIQLNRTIEIMKKDIAALKKTTDDLQKSIAEAPQLENLPKEVASLTKSLADIGSKITAVETNMKQVNDQIGNNEKEKQTLPDRIHNVEEKIDSLLATQQKPTEVQPVLSNLNNEIKKLEDTFSETNSSMWDRFLDIQENFKVVYNLTQRIINLESVVGSANNAVVSTVLDVINGQLPSLINYTVDVALDQRFRHNLSGLVEVNDTIKISTLISYVRNLTRYYLVLLAKTQSVPTIQLQHLNDSLDLSFSGIIQDAVKGLLDPAASVKMQELHAALSDLQALYSLLKNNSDMHDSQLRFLQSRIDQLQSSASSHTEMEFANSSRIENGSQQVGAISGISTFSTLQQNPSLTPMPANDAVQSTQPPPVSVTSTTSLPKPTNAVNVTAAAPHKPSHTGGSLPDADGSQIQPSNVRS